MNDEVGYTLLEMTAVLLILSSLVFMTVPIFRPIERQALFAFVDTLQSDLTRTSQYPYIAEDESCVPRLRWFDQNRTYVLSCGQQVMAEQTVPIGVDVLLPSMKQITFSKTAPSYAGTWRFSNQSVAITMTFRLGSYEPEVTIHET